MTSKTTCPICKLEHIDAKQDHCPQCDADLTCFRVLEALPESGTVLPPEMPHENPDHGAGVLKKPMLFFLGPILVGSLAIVLLWLQLYRIDDLKVRINTGQSAFNAAITGIESRLVVIGAKQERATENLGTHMKSVNAQLKILSNRISENGKTLSLMDNISESKESITPVKPRQQSGTMPFESNRASSDRVNSFHYYQADDKDTLWWIAERFYGSAVYYPVILTHNPDLGIYTISRKSRIAILKDPSHVSKIYKEITETEKGRLYWHYTVRSGDTPASITRRYCPLDACIAIPIAEKSQTGLRPGQTIRIQLSGATQ